MSDRFKAENDDDSQFEDGNEKEDWKTIGTADDAADNEKRSQKSKGRRSISTPDEDTKQGNTEKKKDFKNKKEKKTMKQAHETKESIKNKNETGKKKDKKTKEEKTHTKKEKRKWQSNFSDTSGADSLSEDTPPRLHPQESDSAESESWNDEEDENKFVTESEGDSSEDSA